VCYAVRAQIRLGRDDVRGALADAERGLELARATHSLPDAYRTVARCASVFAESGDTSRAASLADEVLAELRGGRGVGWANEILHVLAWTLSSIGRGTELRDVLSEARDPWSQAAFAFASGAVERAVEICVAMGAAVEEARDRLWLGEMFVTQNRRADADSQLQRALAFYRSVRAARYVKQAEASLTASA